MELLGRRYDTGRPVCLEIAEGKVVRAVPAANDADVETLPWIAPGLIDIQINGYQGQEFSSPELAPEKVASIVRFYDSFGLVRCCPTLFTQSFEVMRHSVATIAEACRSWPDVDRRIAGIHVEGPYLSKEDGPRGAHPLAHCRPPDWDEFQRLQEAAEGRIRILTMAVEFDGAARFIQRVAASGVIVAVGHTAADSVQIRAAVDAGARLGTHLGNGAHPMLPRHPNYIWAQLADDRLSISLIADGYHLPPEVVKTFIRAKTLKRCILISDISGLAGLPPGCYQAGHGTVEILPKGRLVVAGQRKILAGASDPIGTGVVNAMDFAGLTLAEAVSMAVDQPAKLLAIEPGGFQPGDPADLVAFDLVQSSDDEKTSSFEVRATISNGDVVWGAL